MTDIAKSTNADPETEVRPGGYVVCNTCEAILGYKAKVQIGDGRSVTMLHVFSSPAAGTRPGLDKKHVNARLLDGDVYCSLCKTWQPWEHTAPWSK